jgi:hypothetical protein
MIKKLPAALIATMVAAGVTTGVAVANNEATN